MKKKRILIRKLKICETKKARDVSYEPTKSNSERTKMKEIPMMSMPRKRKMNHRERHAIPRVK